MTIHRKDTFSMELNFRTYQSAYQNLTILLKKIDSAFSKHQVGFQFKFLIPSIYIFIIIKLDKLCFK